MSVDLRPLTDANAPDWRDLLEAPGIAHQFDKFVGADAFARLLTDPYLDRESVRLAYVHGEPVGFSLAFVLHSPSREWAMLRVAVRESHRRRGIARALVEAALPRLETTLALPEVVAGTWMPEPGADALAERFGFRPDRTFWLMERPRGGASPVPEWPAGIEVRPLDGSERDLVGWTDAYNDSFEEHYRFVSSTIEETRDMVRAPGFRPDGTLLAWRGDTCVGYAYNMLHAERAEVATLGTVRAARGIGLGRALLRAGVAWIEAQCTLPVTLIVDGENENALRLYRQEGFEVVRTRRVWSRRRDAR